MGQHLDIIMPLEMGQEQSGSRSISLKNPIVIDLGCGAGNFLRDYALRHPEYDFYGFELRYKRLVKGALKFKKHNLNNIRLIQAKAEDVTAWFPNRSVREVHINFPDPWPKKRQLKHRLITPRFLAGIGCMLETGGHLVFKTDHQDYFRPVRSLIEESGLFDVVGYSEDLHNSPLNEENIPTEFEQLFRSKGLPIYFIKSKVR